MTINLEHITKKIPWIKGHSVQTIPNDLEVYKTELLFNEESELDALVFQVIEREGMQEYAGYRAVRLLQLRYISLEARRDAGLLQKMRTVLRGLYGSQVNLIYLAAGVFKNPKIGIVQCYGVSVFSTNKEEAIQQSYRDLRALKAAWWGPIARFVYSPFPQIWHNGWQEPWTTCPMPL